MTGISKKLGAKDRDKAAGKRTLKRNPLMKAGPQEIDDYIENNVTDLASAKEALKLIAKIAILKP